ncbi:hypothetical protein C5167_036709 [Papaver somniferum]|uniref:Uncharacterized protein n=1 Tax=Papaver somniferum TaxID=3469 RepID=A0A4Y7I8M7_PAPSO|nr:hypothetical protein C5167_036709 [Papaver somniferum]
MSDAAGCHGTINMDMIFKMMDRIRYAKAPSRGSQLPPSATQHLLRLIPPVPCIRNTIHHMQLRILLLYFFVQVHKLKKRYRESSENIDIDELQGDFAGIHFGLSMEFNIKALLTIFIWYHWFYRDIVTPNITSHGVLFMKIEERETYVLTLLMQMDNALIDDWWISQTVSKLWSQYRRKEHQTGKGSMNGSS